MPRDITITIFKYDELPTEKAKERARDAMRRFVADNPAWVDDYKKTLKECERLSIDELRALAQRKDDLPLTGFCADFDALEAVEQLDDEAITATAHAAIRVALDRALKADIEGQQEDDAIVEWITANEYEYTASGELYP